MTVKDVFDRMLVGDKLKIVFEPTTSYSDILVFEKGADDIEFGSDEVMTILSDKDEKNTIVVVIQQY